MTTPATRSAPSEQTDGGFTHRQIVTILVGLMMGMFLAALDQTVVSTAIRTIADDLNGFSLQAWATTAFLITSTISTPLYGKLSDIYGRKPFFLFAIAIFIVGSALCGLSQSMYELAAFRAIQGIGAGGLFSLALAIIGDIVPPRERAKYQGYFLAVFGTSSVLGPVLGGFFAGADSILGIAGWRWIFYINVPIGLAALVVVNRVLHIPHTRRDHRIDWPGAVALIVGLVPLLIVAEQGREWGWGVRPRHWSATCIGVVGLVLFFLAERMYGDEALMPLRLFRGRTFAVAATSPADHRHGHVRRDPADAAALPADRQGLLADQGRPGHAAAGARHHGRLDDLRPDDLPDRPLPDLPDHRHRADGRRAAPVLAGRRGHAAVEDRAGHADRRPRPRRQHAADHPGHAERGLAARDRRRDLVGDVLPADGRHARHRGVPVGAAQHAAGQDRRRVHRGRRARRSSRRRWPRTRTRRRPLQAASRATPT